MLIFLFILLGCCYYAGGWYCYYHLISENIVKDDDLEKFLFALALLAIGIVPIVFYLIIKIIKHTKKYTIYEKLTNKAQDGIFIYHHPEKHENYIAYGYKQGYIAYIRINYEEMSIKETKKVINLLINYANKEIEKEEIIKENNIREKVRQDVKKSME